MSDENETHQLRKDSPILSARSLALVSGRHCDDAQAPHRSVVRAGCPFLDEATGKLLQFCAQLLRHEGKERSETRDLQGGHLKSWHRAYKSCRLGNEVTLTHTIGKPKRRFQRPVKAIFTGFFGNGGNWQIGNLRVGNNPAFGYAPAEPGIAESFQPATFVLGGRKYNA